MNTDPTKLGEMVEAETSLEQKAAPIVEILTEKFGATFELIGDTVMCTDPGGVDLGNMWLVHDSARSWKVIMGDEEHFDVTVDGATYDTRAGMTYDAYEAMVRAKAEANQVLPDFYYYDGWNTSTLITGEPELVGDERVPMAGVLRDGSVDRFMMTSDYDDNYPNITIRFRPAVKIATEAVETAERVGVVEVAIAECALSTSDLATPPEEIA